MTNYTAAIEQAKDLRTTINTIGWRVIQQFIEGKKAYYTQIALTSKEINIILHAQAYVMAVEDILAEIDALIKVGDEAEKSKKKKK